MNILVTGGSGFIGSHLVDKLRVKGHEIFNYDVKLDLSYDVRHLRSLRRVIRDFQPDVLFHLAGVLGTSELMQCVREAEAINVLGTISILDVCKEYSVPLVFASKINPPDWLNPYTISKTACEDYCRMYEEQWDLKICILKFLHAYGPRQKAHPVQKYVPTFISKALKNEPIPIWGTGQQHVDPLYVEDAAEAAARVWENDCWGETIEVGLGKGIPVVKVAKLILELTGSSSKLSFLDMRPGEPLHCKDNLYADIRLMRDLLGMRPEEMMQPRDGLKLTVDWWQKK